MLPVSVDSCAVLPAPTLTPNTPLVAGGTCMKMALPSIVNGMAFWVGLFCPAVAVNSTADEVPVATNGAVAAPLLSVAACSPLNR